MKTLFQFLNEARVSQASQEAKKLNLVSDGHGSWRDSRGKLVAKTVGGKLKMLTAQERAAEEGSGKERGKKPEEVKAQPKAAAAPQTVKTKAKPEDAEKSGMMSNDITVVFGRFNPPTIGHEKLLQAAEKAAQGGDFKIYPSRTQDAK